jgi:hypothetical protein
LMLRICGGGPFCAADSACRHRESITSDAELATTKRCPASAARALSLVHRCPHSQIATTVTLYYDVPPGCLWRHPRPQACGGHHR